MCPMNTRDQKRTHARPRVYEVARAEPRLRETNTLFLRRTGLSVLTRLYAGGYLKLGAEE